MTDTQTGDALDIIKDRLTEIEGPDHTMLTRLSPAQSAAYIILLRTAGHLAPEDKRLQAALAILAGLIGAKSGLRPPADSSVDLTGLMN